jgi:nucleoid DNA-binding protein
MDIILKKIIDEIVDELGIERKSVVKYVHHFFNESHYLLANKSSVALLFKGLGTFRFYNKKGTEFMEEVEIYNATFKKQTSNKGIDYDAIFDSID